MKLAALAILLAAAVSASPALKARSAHPLVIRDAQDQEYGRFLVRLAPARSFQEAVAGFWSPNVEQRAHFAFNTLRKHAEQSQASILEFLRSQGGSVRRINPIYISNVIAVEAKRSVIDALMQREDVEAVVPNTPIKVDLEHSRGPAFEASSFVDEEPDWNVKYVNATVVWSRYNSTGEGTVYANADTGIDWTHPALQDNYAGYNPATKQVNHNYAWWDGVKNATQPGLGPCGVNSQTPCDDNGHGTHTTSTAVGKVVGVAPGAKWIGCRNMDRGLGTPESYLSCLQFFLAPTDLQGKNPDPSRRPNAIGNSYGCPSAEGCTQSEFTRAIEALLYAGVFMSVSAGNDGPGCGSVSAPPAVEPLVTSVAALSFNSDSAARFSSRGPAIDPSTGKSINKPEISAPGTQVRGAIPGGKYANYQGTSMASPHLGGAVLLVSQVCPKLRYQAGAIRELFQATARPLAYSPSEGTCGTDTRTTIPNNVYGYGALDIAAAAAECAKASDFIAFEKPLGRLQVQL